MATTIQTIETPKRARALDTSGNNNHGQIYSGRALEFDGVTDYFQHNGGTAITGVNSFANGSPWTFACWMYFDSGGGGEDHLIGADYTSQHHFIFNYSSGQIRFRDANADFYTFSSTKLDTNTWYRVVITTDGTSMTAYVNGIVYGTIAANQANVAANDNFDTTEMKFTGWGMPYQSGFVRGSGFMGMMSDGQVWDANWTADDVTYDYLNPESLVLNRGGTSLTNSNLKIWYPMQDGHRGQQSYILDASNTGLGDENIDLTTGSTSEPAEWGTATTSGITKLSGGTSVTYYETGFTVTSGKTYKVTLTLTDYAGSSNLGWSNSGGIPDNAKLSSDGSYTGFFTATSTAELKLFGRDVNSGTFSNVSVKAVNDKNHATTVFYGDELIADAKNRTFASGPDWQDSGTTANQFAEDSGVYDEAATSGADESTALTAYDGTTVTFTDNYLKLVATSDATHIRLAELDGGKFETNMVVGRTYRLSYAIDLTAYTSGTLHVGFGETSASEADARKAYTAITTLADGTESPKSDFFDFIYKGTTTHAKLFIQAGTSSAFTVYFDNFSIKEVGLASGWTDADQQLHIPQTALQSYNEWAWSLPTTGDNMIATVSDHTDFDINSSDFTANCWVYLNDYGFGNGQYIFHKGGGGGEGWHVRVRINGVVAFIVDDGVADVDGVNIATANSGSNGVKLGRWHMITATVDHSATIALYIDGQLIESTAFPSANNDIDGADGLEMLNWHSTYTNGSLNGTATEFSIFKGVELKEAEINELYNDGKALDATTHSKVAYLKGYWRNDGLNTTWNDLSGENRHATLSNGTETMLCPSGVDSSRCSQGFIMNKQRNTSSLNLPVTKNRLAGLGVDINHTSEFSLGTGDFTLEVWAKAGYTQQPNSAGSYSSFNTIISLGENVVGSDVAAISYYGSANKFRFHCGGDTNQYIIDSDVVAKGNWYHVVAGRASGVGFLYLNGESQAANKHGTYNISAVNINNTEKKTVGYDGGNDARNYTEPIDGVKIYGDALSAPEVLRNYKATKGSHRN